MSAQEAICEIRRVWIALPRSPAVAVWWNGRRLVKHGNEADGDVLIGHFNRNITLQDFTALVLDEVRWDIPSAAASAATQTEARA